MSGRFVAAIIIIPSFSPNPSISTRSWFNVCSRSSCPPPTPAPPAIPAKAALNDQSSCIHWMGGRRGPPQERLLRLGTPGRARRAQGTHPHPARDRRGRDAPHRGRHRAQVLQWHGLPSLLAAGHQRVPVPHGERGTRWRRAGPACRPPSGSSAFAGNRPARRCRRWPTRWRPR